MTTRLHKCLLILTFFGVTSNFVARGLPVGKVTIGTPGNESTSLSYSDNEAQAGRWYFDVYVQVINESTGEFVDVENNVTISCSLTPAWSGYSSVEFEVTIVEAPNASAPNFTTVPVTQRVYFNTLKPGRPVVLRCWGESVIEVIDPGENGTQENVTKLFTKEGSISPPVNFVVYRRGMVNICSGRVLVPFSNNSNDNTGTFDIELSDPVESGTSVNITCTAEPLDASNPQDSMVLVFTQPLELKENETKAQMKYVRVAGTLTVVVSCGGQSIYIIGNDTFDDGTQYQPNTSRAEPVEFVLDRGYVSMYPQISTVRSSQMKLFVMLDAPVKEDVIFTCRAETVESSEEAVDVAENPYCQSITETVVERPYSNITDTGDSYLAQDTSTAETTSVLTTSVGRRESTVTSEQSSPQTGGPRETTTQITTGSGTNAVSTNLPVSTTTYMASASTKITSGTMGETSVSDSTATELDSTATTGTSSEITTDPTTSSASERTLSAVTQVRRAVSGATVPLTAVTDPVTSEGTSTVPTTNTDTTDTLSTADPTSGPSTSDSTSELEGNTTTAGYNSTTPDYNTTTPDYNTTTVAYNETLSNYTTVEPTTQPPPTTVEATTEPVCYVYREVFVNETVVIETLVNGTLVNMSMETFQVVNETVAVNCSDLYPVTTPAPTPVYNRTLSEWTVLNPKVEFKRDGARYAELTVTRSSRPTELLQELVVVTCCAPAEQVNPKYKGKSTAALVVSALTPNVTVNWTSATLPDNVEDESPIKNPAYVELAPCPCDLTKALCDNNCCCDSDCSEADRGLFTCTPGVEGGRPAPPPTYSCDAPPVGRDDWFPFLCVHKENTAFLGYFYPALPAVRSEVDFRVKALEQQPPYTYRETEERTKFETSRSYVDGSKISTGDAERKARKNFLLGLPQKSLLGECVKTSPVRYLHDIDSECTRTMNENLCSAASPLSATVYAQATGITNPPCPYAPIIIKEGGTNNIATVKTHYLCSTDSSKYLKSTQLHSDIFTPTWKSLFSSPLDTEDCHFNAETNAFVCQPVANVTINEEVDPPLCDFDDGYTPPPTPVYDNNTQICHNAVLEVRYNFTWKGSEILLLNATYILGDLPMELERVDSYSFNYREESDEADPQGGASANTTTSAPPATTEATTGADNGTTVPPDVDYDLPAPYNVSVTVTKFPAVVSQKFDVVFWQEFTLKSNSSDDTGRTDRYKRSGKIGYVADLPIISGVAETNNSDVTVVTDVTRRLSLWSPGPGGLCAGSGRQDLLFQQDATSSCVLRLGLSDLHHGCNDLRKQILHHQDALMSSALVSRNGDPNITSLTQWITVLRENISSIIPPPEEVSMTTAGSMTTGSRTTVSVTTAATTTADTSDIPVDVTTANMTTNDTETARPIDTEVIGRCPNIPSGVHVDIMYALAGLVNARPVYEIVGAKISYALSMWELQCSGADGAACLGNLSRVAVDNAGQEVVQSFTLTSSVNFHLVPGKDEPRLTRSEEQKARRMPVCQGEACWEGLFYPFQVAFAGDPLQYVRAVTSTWVVFVVGYLLISRPWW